MSWKTLISFAPRLVLFFDFIGTKLIGSVYSFICNTLQTGRQIDIYKKYQTNVLGGQSVSIRSKLFEAVDNAVLTKLFTNKITSK